MTPAALSLDEALQSLATDGYIKLQGVFSLEQMNAALKEVQAISASYPYERIKGLPKLDQGQQVIYNLQNKSLMLLKLVLANPLIQQILCSTLNDQWHKAIPLDQPNYILRSYQARNNRVATPMHLDSYIPYQGQHPLSIQVSLVLEQQTREKGCTVLVPGSHQSDSYVNQADRDKALAIESEAGDVVIWDSRIWHGTGENLSGQSRWSLIATFVRWWVKQGYGITDSLPDEIYQGLSASERAVLGFCSIPFRDEFEGIDFKTGYDSLPDTLEPEGKA